MVTCRHVTGRILLLWNPSGRSPRSSAQGGRWPPGFLSPSLPSFFSTTDVQVELRTPEQRGLLSHQMGSLRPRSLPHAFLLRWLAPVCPPLGFQRHEGNRFLARRSSTLTRYSLFLRHGREGPRPQRRQRHHGAPPACSLSPTSGQVLKKFILFSSKKNKVQSFCP